MDYGILLGMARRKLSSAEDVLKNSVAEIEKLRKMGITDYAVITYAVRLQSGQAREAALQALLHGRSLTEEQIQFVRATLQRVSAQEDSNEAGYVVLEAWLVRSLDYVVDWEKIWFGGLFLIVSPLVTWTLLEPLATLYLMLFGLLCSCASMTIPGLAE